MLPFVNYTTTYTFVVEDFMNVKSLALRTNLIFDNFSGEIIDRGKYLVIKTVTRPNYFWGNYLIMSEPPSEGDLTKWIGLYEKEIGPKDERGFIALTFDAIDGEQGVIQPFLDYGFSVQESTVLATENVHKSNKHNPKLIVRPLSSDDDWESYIDIHFQPDWEYSDDQSQKQFLKKEVKELQAMVDAGLGMRLGVELDGKLVGETGIYWDKQVGRFNNVGTHRDFRRQGVCSTLIYEASKIAFETKGLQTLVMEADLGSHAADIYESVGFKAQEKLIALEWYDKTIIK